MRVPLFVLAVAALFSCANPPSQEVERNAPRAGEPDAIIQFERWNSVDTFLIARNVIYLRQSGVEMTPLRQELIDRFGDFEDHPAIEFLARLNPPDDVVIGYLFHRQDYPNFGKRHEISPWLHLFFGEDLTSLEQLDRRLLDFYLEANVQAFIDEQSETFADAEADIRAVIGDRRLAAELQEFAGEAIDRFVLVPQPMFITDSIRGIGPRIETQDGALAYQVINAYDNLRDMTSEEKASRLRNLITHEFGHSFVNHHLIGAEFQAYLAEREQLFTPVIQGMVRGSGVSNVYAYYIEHLVRLLETRVAEVSGRPEDAQRLREENAGFPYLPEMERLMVEQFEANREQYPTYADFFSVLLTVPDYIDISDFRPDDIVPTGRAVEQPSRVTLAGSFQKQLGCAEDWNPACSNSRLERGGDDDVWRATFDLPSGSYQYKVAIDEAWRENYGANAVPYGADMAFDHMTPGPVSFYYDHETHWATSSAQSDVFVGVGDFQSEMGCPDDWRRDCLRAWLQDSNDDGVSVFSTTQITPGAYEVVVTRIAPDGKSTRDMSQPRSFEVKHDGAPVVFRFDSAANELTVGSE